MVALAMKWESVASAVPACPSEFSGLLCGDRDLCSLLYLFGVGGDSHAISLVHPILIL